MECHVDVHPHVEDCSDALGIQVREKVENAAPVLCPRIHSKIGGPLENRCKLEQGSAIHARGVQRREPVLRARGQERSAERRSSRRKRLHAPS